MHSGKLKSGAGVVVATVLVCVIVAVYTPKQNAAITTEYVYADIDNIDAVADNPSTLKDTSNQVWRSYSPIVLN